MNILCFCALLVRSHALAISWRGARHMHRRHGETREGTPTPQDQTLHHPLVVEGGRVHTPGSDTVHSLALQLAYGALAGTSLAGTAAPAGLLNPIYHLSGVYGVICEPIYLLQ